MAERKEQTNKQTKREITNYNFYKQNKDIILDSMTAASFSGISWQKQNPMTIPGLSGIPYCWQQWKTLINFLYLTVIVIIIIAIIIIIIKIITFFMKLVALLLKSLSIITLVIFLTALIMITIMIIMIVIIVITIIVIFF